MKQSSLLAAPSSWDANGFTQGHSLLPDGQYADAVAWEMDATLNKQIAIVGWLLRFELKRDR